jgi:hypothetical protein
MLSTYTGASLRSVLLWLLVLLLNGWIWIYLVSYVNLKRFPIQQSLRNE